MTIKLSKWLKSLLYSGFVAAEFCCLLFIVFRLTNVTTELFFLFFLFFLSFSLICTLCCCYSSFSTKRKLAALAVIPVLFALLIGFLLIFCRIFTPKELDSGKDSFFSNKNVMIIVPHQDDEVLLAGGIIENYVAAGSNIKIVFTTAGDYLDIGEWRMEEAISVAQYYQIDETNIIFLGYGNEWEGDFHIYNAPSNQIMLSINQRDKTYGLPFHPAYHEGNPYTRTNFIDDLKSLLDENRPDVIYCIDYDSHVDHRATSLFFDEAMGKLLKENGRYYQPVVYKGFAYSCSLKADKDFDSKLNASTKCPYETHFMAETNVYNWENRVRVPVSSSCLADKAENTSCASAIKKYKSQNLILNAAAIVNGDKVFWERKTTSLLYDSSIFDASGEVSILTDYKIYDSENILDEDSIPTDGVWIPDKSAMPIIDIVLTAPVEMSSIVLYDNPSLENNVLALTVIFDDGTKIYSNDIYPNGAPSIISFSKRTVGSFQIKIEKSEGNQSGFTEIEAYYDKPIEKDHLIKIIDGNDDFIYYYYFGKEEVCEFSLYTYHAPSLTEDNYTVISTNRKIKAEIKGDKVRITCPSNYYGRITVANQNGDYSDTICVYGKNRQFLHQFYMKIAAWRINTFNLPAIKEYIKTLLQDLGLITFLENLI